MPSFANPAARTACAVRAETRAAAPGTIESRTHAEAIEHYSVTWRGIEILIVYAPNSTGTPECPYSHLEVMTDRPRRPLPMTETGYQSLFLPAGSIEAQGSPVDYVTRWLDHAAKSVRWRATERDMRQGSLF